MKFVTHNYQKNWLFSRNNCFEKSTSSKKVATWKKYLFRKSTYSKQLLILEKKLL